MRLFIIASLSLMAGNVRGALEEAPYTVVAEHEGGWEERDYPPTRWVSTQAFDILPHDGLTHQQAFYRLFNYIDGQNAEGMKIPMTAPVSFRILPGEGPNCESNYTMSFLVPSLLQESTPAPTDPSIYLEDRPALKLAALRFSGIPHDMDFTIRGAELYEMAMAAGVQVSDVPLWTAGYDGPAVIVNRRNEVWLEIVS